MHINLTFNPELKRRFPDLMVSVKMIRDIRVEASSPELEMFKEKVIGEVKNNYNLESIKEEPTFKAYRSFFWRIKVDPTKIRPASEALIRRILAGKRFPKINTFVDAYNLASVISGIPLAAFDSDRLKGDLIMRFAEKGELFLGIGMGRAMELKGNEVVISDQEKIVAVYPYRDSEATKITERTRNVVVMACGVPGIGRERLDSALDTAIRLVIRFCGGVVG